MSTRQTPTPNEANVLRALQDAPPWWPSANPLALLSILHGHGSVGPSSTEGTIRALRGLARKGYVHRDPAGGWHLGADPEPPAGEGHLMNDEPMTKSSSPPRPAATLAGIITDLEQLNVQTPGGGSFQQVSQQQGEWIASRFNGDFSLFNRMDARESAPWHWKLRQARNNCERFFDVLGDPGLYKVLEQQRIDEADAEENDGLRCERCNTGDAATCECPEEVVGEGSWADAFDPVNWRRELEPDEPIAAALAGGPVGDPIGLMSASASLTVADSTVDVMLAFDRQDGELRLTLNGADCQLIPAPFRPGQVGPAFHVAPLSPPEADAAQTAQAIREIGGERR